MPQRQTASASNIVCLLSSSAFRILAPDLSRRLCQYWCRRVVRERLGALAKQKWIERLGYQHTPSRFHSGKSNVTTHCSILGCWCSKVAQVWNAYLQRLACCRVYCHAKIRYQWIAVTTNINILLSVQRPITSYWLQWQPILRQSRVRLFQWLCHFHKERLGHSFKINVSAPFARHVSKSDSPNSQAFNLQREPLSMPYFLKSAPLPRVIFYGMLKHASNKDKMPSVLRA